MKGKNIMTSSLIAILAGCTSTAPQNQEPVKVEQNELVNQYRGDAAFIRDYLNAVVSGPNPHTIETIYDHFDKNQDGQLDSIEGQSLRGVAKTYLLVAQEAENDERRELRREEPYYERDGF